MITRIKIKGLYVWLELKSTSDNKYQCYYYFREPSEEIPGTPVLNKQHEAARFSDLQTALMMGVSVSEKKIIDFTRASRNISGNRYN